MSNNKFKVLIIEDEANICSFIQTLLETNGYQALVAQTCMMGMTMFISYNPDLVILDLGLPDRDGLDAIRSIRQKYLTPIIVLSARTTEQDKIEALDLGANDYITKPFGTGELLARVRALTRRQGEVALEELTCYDLRLELATHTLNCGTKSVRLSPKEFEVLRLLMSAPGGVIPKDQLISRVWGLESEAEDNNVEVYISFLRKKLDHLRSAVKIRTIRMVGYCLEVPES